MTRTVRQSPVVESANFALKATSLVQLNEAGVTTVAGYIKKRFDVEHYTPRTWRTQPLHLLPAEPFSPSHPSTRATLDWLFLVSSLNFSFWSPLEDSPTRFGIEWRTGWDEDDNVVWTGYWCLLAGINRAIDDGYPLLDPSFYSSPDRCPDSLIKDFFRPAPQCEETMPLLDERIAVMRECGAILINKFGGSFTGFIDAWRTRYDGRGTALQLVEMVVETFPTFRDEVTYKGRTVKFWKRAQILVAELWAAFYPEEGLHPFFPFGVGQLTMFADYRVPQILHHLQILRYPPSLEDMLRNHIPIAHGSREEISIRAASIIAVERLRSKIREQYGVDVTSVLIDFYLWDHAKLIEQGQETIHDVRTIDNLPAHRTRSIWY